MYLKNLLQANLAQTADGDAIKISPVRGRMVDTSKLTFVLTSKSRDTKLGRIPLIRPDQI